MLGRCFGATDFGEFNEAYDPVREKAIKENREHISKTRGEAAAKKFDEEVSKSKAERTGTPIVAASEETKAPAKSETKSVAESTKTADGKPVIKLGEVVESKGEKVKKDIPPRVKGKDVEKMVNEDSASKPKTIKDEIIDAAISSGTKKTEKDEEGKDIDEKVADKIKEKTEEKLDPVSKVENFIEKKKDEAVEELKDSIFKADDEAFAREVAEKEGKDVAARSSTGSFDLDDSSKPTKATPAPISATEKGMDAAVDPATKGAAASKRIVDAGGKTAADTPAARAVLAADKAADGSLFGMTPKAAAKTVGEDIMAMSRSVARGFKDSKNLRLAATAALLSSAGYGLGKARNRMGAKQNQEVSPDESEMLRRSLLEDG